MPDSLDELFDTRATFQRAVGTVLSLAKKEICVFDADLRNLEFDARVRADMISAFLAGGRDRSVRMVLHELDHVNRNSPRLMGLLKRYSHCFSIRQTPESLRNLADAFVLADGVEVAGAGLDHGLLHIDLRRQVPETVVQTIRISKK